MRLIDADVLAAYFMSLAPDFYSTACIVGEIMMAPTISTKEQEPVKPIKPRGSASWICGACKKAIGTSLIYNFCPWCGRRVKLE